MSSWGDLNMADLDSNRRGFSASIRHLRLFESVAQLQGVRRASEECHLSQPAVTQAIAKLEEQLGVQLLLRCATGSYLNEFGIIFHARTQRFFSQVEQALLELGVPSSPFPLARVASRITRSQIRSLLAIVENGTFAQAARALGVSQTSLQRAARDLERTLRTPLYIQTAAGIHGDHGCCRCRPCRRAIYTACLLPAPLLLPPPPLPAPPAVRPSSRAKSRWHNVRSTLVSMSSRLPAATSAARSSSAHCCSPGVRCSHRSSTSLRQRFPRPRSGF